MLVLVTVGSLLLLCFFLLGLLFTQPGPTLVAFAIVAVVCRLVPSSKRSDESGDG